MRGHNPISEFVSKVHGRRSGELEQGIESHEIRMWLALAAALSAMDELAQDFHERLRAVEESVSVELDCSGDCQHCWQDTGTNLACVMCDAEQP